MLRKCYRTATVRESVPFPDFVADSEMNGGSRLLSLLNSGTHRGPFCLLDSRAHQCPAEPQAQL
jgi:hypothetical protein